MIVFFVAHADEIHVATQVRDVMLYLDRAVINRSAIVKLPEGQHVLVFKNLPATLIDQSVRFDAHPDKAGLDIMAVTIENVVLTTPEYQQDPRWLALVEKQQQYDTEMQSLQNSLRLNEVKIQHLQRYMEMSMTSSGTQQRLSIEEFTEIEQFIDQKIPLLMTVNAQRLHQINQLSQKIDELSLEKAQLVTELTTPQKVIYVHIKTPQTMQISPQIKYTVMEAGWMPYYTLHLDRHNNMLDFRYTAKVYQNTREDWHDVKLKLSTTPLQPRSLPIFRSWNIGIREENNIPILSANEAVMAARMSSPAYDTLSVAIEENVLQADVSDHLTHVQFNISYPVSLKGHGQSGLVTIHTHTLEAQVNYQVYPAVQSEAFLNVVLRNETLLPWLQGQASLLMDQQFITNTILQTTMPQQNVSFAYGTEPRVTAKRTQLKQFNAQEGVFSKVHMQHHHYEIQLKNDLDHAIELTVFEQIPVSTNAAINVRLIEPKHFNNGAILSLEESERFQAQGRITWLLPLAAGQQHRESLKFRVEYPIDTAIYGL